MYLPFEDYIWKFMLTSWLSFTFEGESNIFVFKVVKLDWLTTDYNCYNFTVLRAFLTIKALCVLSLKYLQDMNGLLIVFYKWLVNGKCEWN